MVRLLPGMTWSSLKHHKALMPLFVSIAGGMGLAAAYLTRLATKSVEVSWKDKRNGEAWNKLSPTYQYKFYSPVRDYSKETFPAERPEL